MRMTRAALGILFGSSMLSAAAWAGGEFSVSVETPAVDQALAGAILIPEDLRDPTQEPFLITENPDNPNAPGLAIFLVSTRKSDPEPVLGRSSGELGVSFEVLDDRVAGATGVLSFDDVISFEQDTTDGVAVQLALTMPVHGVISGLGVGDAVTGRAFQRITPQDAIDVGGTIQFQQRFFEARYFDDDGQPGVRVCHASNLDTLDLLLDFGTCDEEGELAFSLGGSSNYLGENFLFELGFEFDLSCGASACDPGIRIDFDQTFAPSFRAGPFQAELPISSASGLFGAQANGPDEVPEPESLALLALALLGLGALRRRRVV